MKSVGLFNMRNVSGHLVSVARPVSQSPTATGSDGAGERRVHFSAENRLRFLAAWIDPVAKGVEAKLFETLRGGTVLAGSTELPFSRSVENRRRRAGGSEDMHGESRVSALITRKRQGAGLSRTVWCLRALHPHANKFQSIYG